jgi:tetratricopeptide (TPR) repeat protein
MDEHEKATAFYDRALELDADNVSTILGQAAVAIDEREYDEAEALIQRALELVPDAPQPYAQYGDLCLERDEVDEARAHFREALSREENYWPALVGICEVHLHEQECEGAARQAQDLMALQPRLGDGRVYMGFARLCSGDINKALEYFRKAQELEPHSPSAYAGLGLAYGFQGRWEESLSAYVEALRLSPARAPMHCYLADSFMGQAEVEWAKAELRTALNLDPDLLEAHGGLAEILLSEGNAVEASAQAEEALALDEDHPYAMRLLGMALFAQDSPDEAAKVLEDLLANEPEDALGHFFLGLAYRDLARYADAKKHLETNLALDPSGDVAAMSQSLVLALDRGYVLTEDKAISDITEVLAMVLDADTDVHVEDVELEGRTLVISFAADPESQQEELLADLSSAMSVAALFAPRIDPAIENAVDVYVDVDGKPTYKLRMSAEAAKKFADGVLAPGEVASELQFSRTIAGTTEATIEKVEKDLAETRELEARAEVPYHAMTREDLQQYLTERTDAQAREAMRSSDLLLTLLGVIGPEDDLEQMLRDLDVGQVAGFYDSDEKHFYVLEDQEQTALEQMTVAHEYVHALQDQHFDLEELDSKALDGDGRRAFDALVEGDAVLAMVLYGDEHVEYVDLLQAMCSAGGLGSEALEASPAFIREMELFPYDRGVEFVLALFQSGGWEAVNQAYDNPPQSTEQVLHPERYREEDEPQEVSLPDLAEELGGDWRTLDCEVMGELGLRLVLAQHVAPAAAMLAAEGWAGDRYALLQKGADGPLVLVMRTVWDDRDEADQFWALYDLYARHRAGYTEDVTELVGKVSTRWWQSDHGWAFAEQEDRYVTAILGPDKQTISDVLDALHGS